MIDKLLLLLCFIMVFNCSGTNPNESTIGETTKGEVTTGEVIMEEPMKRLYPLIDNKVIMHKYRDNFDKMIFPKHNAKLTQYCSLHRDWEDIKAVWSKNGGDEFRWQYYVVKNKKSFK